MVNKRTLRDLGYALSCEIKGNPDYLVDGVDELKSATESDVSFFANPRYLSDFQLSQAGIICTTKEQAQTKNCNYLISTDPALTFQRIIQIFCPDASLSGFKEIHPTAVIHPTAKIGKDVSIGPYVVIDRDVTIEDSTKISPHVSIGPEVEIGKNCILYPHVVVRERCKLGDRVILQPGVVIGGCGFGYIQNERNESQKIPHFGGVIIEDDVEIGANTTVDQGKFKPTLIKRGAKIDNLVMLAHNTKIGKNTLVIAQTGISGSTEIGDNCILAGQVGIVGHLKIADGVIITAQSGVSKSIPQKGIYSSGLPLLPNNEFRTRAAHLNRLDKYATRIKALEKKIEEIENKQSIKSSC